MNCFLRNKQETFEGGVILKPYVIKARNADANISDSCGGSPRFGEGSVFSESFRSFFILCRKCQDRK